MGLNRWRVRLVRFAFHHLYTTFAFLYDTVSAGVSMGEWRAWQRAALPRVQGQRVLEIAFGTGDLQLDLWAAGYAPFGLDASSSMTRIARDKLRRADFTPRLARGRVQALPFPAAAFDAIVMTFAPAFFTSPTAVTEMHRTLARGGRLIAVDVGQVERRGVSGWLIDLAFRFTSASPSLISQAESLSGFGFEARVEIQQCARSSVQVLIAMK